VPVTVGSWWLAKSARRGVPSVRSSVAGLVVGLGVGWVMPFVVGLIGVSILALAG
jgi:hypothetical protein